MKRNQRLGLVAFMAALAVSCETDVADRMLRIDSVGLLSGVLFVDENLSGGFGPNDRTLAGVTVGARRPGEAQDVKTTVTGSMGEFEFELPVGDWTITVPDAVIGDSLVRVGLVEVVEVFPFQMTTFEVGLRFPTISPTEARAAAVGTKVWVRGVALNAPTSFGDSTVHIQEAGVAIRFLAMPPIPLFPGDSAFLLGTRTTRNGEPAVETSTCHPATPTCFVTIAGVTFQPTPVALSTADAATADNGRWDAALARITNATISDTATAATPDSSFLVTVDDGSGPLTVVLSSPVNWGPFVPYAPGARLTAVGVLVPTGTAWQLKPRSTQDLTVQPSPPGVLERRPTRSRVPE